jgi:hypothetical protein
MGGEKMQISTIIVAFVLFALSVAAVKTAFPSESASKACLLGYKAVCSFTPISTVILVVAVIGTFMLAKWMTWI